MEVFSITKQENNGICIVTCSGRFDAYTMPEIKPVLDAATAEAPANVLVDLEAVTFIDSTALAELVRGMKNARLKEGDLVLCRLQQSVRIIFELTRLDKAFTIVDDVDAGLASFE